jgi:molybdopterin-guanine dinucleotide biosynthesis protein A
VAETPAIYGLVLAGGRSRRFGRDKAAVCVQGQTLLERTVGLMQGRIDEVFVSVRADQMDDELRSGFSLIPDHAEGLGPAGGLLSAHARHPDAAWFVLACDLPFLTPAALDRLLRARNPRKAATAYRNTADDLPEPLCAIYEPDTLARFAGQVGADTDLSPRALLARSDIELISPASDAVLANVNTPDDLSRLQASGDAE